MSAINSVTTIVAATEGEAEGIAALGLDPIAMLLQAGTFLILFVIIRKYALDKIVKGLDDRRTKIENSIKEAEELERRNASAQEETAKLLKEARTEADVVIAKAHEEAGAIVSAAEELAVKKAEKVAADAQGRIEADVLAAKKELRSELTALVAEATEAVIGEKMDAEKDKKLIERMLKG